MSVLTDARQALKELLDGRLGGASVFTELPEVVMAPFAVVAPGEPYLEFPEGTPFGWARANLLACFYVAWGSNDVMTAALDQAALDIIAAVNDSDGFLAIQVDQPGEVVINGQRHLGIAVEIVTDVEL